MGKSLGPIELAILQVNERMRSFLGSIRERLDADRVGTQAVPLVNVVVTVSVVAFIAYQALTLLTKAPRREIKVPASTHKETTDRGCGDESLFADLHAHMLLVKEVPYRTCIFDDEDSVRNSQLFYEQMKNRRSIRSFSQRPVPFKVMQNIIKTAGCSPSVGNLQPWKFCLIADVALKECIRAMLEEDERENCVQRTGSDWVVDSAEKAWKRYYLTEAPFLIVVCHEIFQELNDRKERLFHYNQISTSIAIGVLLTAIRNAGLSTVVTSPLNSANQISRLLKRPDNECTLLLLPVGFAADEATVPDLKRKPVEHIIKLY